MKIEKKIWLSLIASVLFAVIFSIWIFRQDTVRNELPFDNTTSLKTTSFKTDGAKTESVILSDEFHTQKAILFQTTHTNAEVWLDGKLIYQYGNEKHVPKFMKSPGSCWHIVDIPANSDTKKLTVKIIPVYQGYYGNPVHLFLGTRGDCILKILSQSLGILILSCGVLFLGFLSLVLYIAVIRKKQEDFSEETSKIFLNLGIFSLLIALWSLKQCGFLQFLVPDGRTLYFIDFFTFYLFPVPFNFLLYDICKSKFQKGALFLSVSYLINMGAAVLLQCMGIVDIFLILPITHLIMFVNAAYTIGLIHYEAKQLGNELARKFRYPMYLIMCFSLSELLVYYIRRFQQTSVFLPLGTLLFILMLIWIQVSQYYEQCIQKQKLIYFQKLANIDMLTEAMNRNAYENMIRYLDEQELELHTTGVVLLDLDNLKEINDNFGHEKGDEALKLCYQCIRQAFPSEQNCFRIGGDEFAYIFHKDEKELIADNIHKLELLLNEKDQDLSYSLSVSSGYAYYQPDTDMDFKDIVRRSDTMLYREKRRKKISHSASSHPMLSSGKQSRAQGITDELITQEKKYQHISPTELCGIIDLLSPSTDDYLYFVDFRTDFYYIAPQSLERFCVPQNAFYNVMETHRDFVYAEDYPLLTAEFRDLLTTNRCIHNMEYRWLDLNGNPVWINCRGYLVRDDYQKPLYMVGCINEIGEKQKADNISGLFGENGLIEYLKTQETPLENGFLLRLGIDNFKSINEKFGWDYGDYILRKTAECISHCISGEQQVYKLSSDEFIIVDITSDDKQTAVHLYNKIRENINQFIKKNHYTAIFTISGGILPFYNLLESEYDEMMKRTDFSLNTAKKRGRNRYYLFNEQDYQRFLHLKDISDVLHAAVIHDFRGFSVALQPLVKEGCRQPFGAETLMRFSSGQFGTISPAEFIPILEESGLIIPAGRWIIREALQACKKLRETIPDFQVSINISQIQIEKSDVIQDISAELENAKLPPEALIVELTESALLEDNSNARHFLKELRKAGIRLALDDFGTGYSNFHYLNELRPDIIKIDRSFTAKAIKDAKEYDLLKRFCTMIHRLNIKICIEGVETEDEWEKIRLMDPDYSQGYLWGKPCSFDELLQKGLRF